MIPIHQHEILAINILSMESLLLVCLLLAVAAIATFYLTGIESSRITRKWLAKLANGERITEEANVGWRSWLLPVHREARGASKKMEEFRAGAMETAEKLKELEFMQHFILGSLIEGVMVVNEKHEITLVNSEFLNIFQFQQSPVRQTVKEALADDKLDGIIKSVLLSGKVQTGNIRRQSQTSGRPPSFEISAIPVRVSQTRVASVVVLFLPPPDRPRMVQILKLHAEKIERLADEWTRRGNVLLRSTVADQPDEPALPPENRIDAAKARDQRISIKS
jgi:PAS domain-containing protein